MTHSIVFLALCLVSLNSFALKMDAYRRDVRKITVKGHSQVGSYSDARRIILQKVHLKSDKKGYYVEDVYCKKLVRNNVGPNRMPNHTIINIEHTWPQSRFSSKHSHSLQKTDLHHLYPTDSKANGTRGNHIFYEISDSFGLSGCSTSKYSYERTVGSNVFEPPRNHKGNVARALFYFSVRYDIDISSEEESILRDWHRIDPVDQEERNRNAYIKSVQGNTNPFIDDPDLVDIISDF